MASKSRLGRQRTGDEELAGIMGNCYLDGFWQSEHYFLANRDTILRDFSFAPGRLTGKIQIDARKIRSCNAVALHIRRGDYVNEKAVTTYVNLFEEGYYRRAIEQMEQLVKDPVFFIFSDDIGWARVHFGISGPYELMEPPAAGDYQDLYLMSLCKHHIIANSSFSWWGAWLCNTPGQVVIAPQKWFLNPAIKTDIIPARWISL